MMTNEDLEAHIDQAHHILPAGDWVRQHAALHVRDAGRLTHYHHISPDTARGEEFLGDPEEITAPELTEAVPAPAKHMTVVWQDGHSEAFPIGPKTPWKVSPQRRTLVLGRRTPRIEIPLDGVRYYVVGDEL